MRYCFDDNEFHEVWSLSTDSLLGLAPGEILSGSSIMTATHDVSQFSYLEPGSNGCTENGLQIANTNLMPMAFSSKKIRES